MHLSSSIYFLANCLYPWVGGYGEDTDRVEDLKKLIDYKPTEEELDRKMKEVEAWKKEQIKSRPHETDF